LSSEVCCFQAEHPSARKNFSIARPRAIDWDTVSFQSRGSDIANYLVWPLLLGSELDFDERFCFAESEAASAIAVSIDEWRSLLLWHALREAAFWSPSLSPADSARLSFAQAIEALRSIF